MITSAKIEIFKFYKGYYDGYYIQNESKPMIITDDEWFLLDNLIQDIHLIRKGVVSKSYETKIVEKIKTNFDSEETYNLVFELEKYING